MPESEMSLPACLRDGLTAREQSILTMARHHGGLDLIAREMDGIANVHAAAVELDAAKAKAARILSIETGGDERRRASMRRDSPRLSKLPREEGEAEVVMPAVPDREDWPHTTAVTRRAVPQSVNGDHAEVEPAFGPMLGPPRGKVDATVEEQRAIAKAKRERRNGNGHARVRMSVGEFQGERDVIDVALDVAGVPAGEADTIRAEADGAGSPDGDPPPASSASAEEGFEYERPDPAPREEEEAAVSRRSGADARREAWRRREAIVELLRARGPMSATALRDVVGGTPHRIRQDLAALEATGVGLVVPTGEEMHHGRGRASHVWRAVSEEELCEREAQLDEDPAEDATSDGGDPSATGVESSTAAPELPAADPHPPCEVGGLGSEDSDAAPESPAPADPPASSPAPDDSPDTPPAREAEPDELGGVPPSQPSPDEPADVVDRVKRSPAPVREVVVGDAGDDPAVPLTPRAAAPSREDALLRRVRREREESDRRLADIAAELLREGEELAASLDGALPETLLRARYLAALLKQIEQGDTSPELLDRFERLAGFASEG
jgi:hypothetical protein